MAESDHSDDFAPVVEREEPRPEDTIRAEVARLAASGTLDANSVTAAMRHAIEPASREQRRALEDFFLRMAPDKTEHYLALHVDALSRFVPKGSEEPPASRFRVCGPIAERWVAVERRVRPSADSLEIVRAAVAGAEVIGWQVTVRYIGEDCDCTNRRLSDYDEQGRHTICGRTRPPRTESADEFAGRVGSIQLGPRDDATYNGHYPTLAGMDIATHNPLKQGMEAFQDESAVLVDSLGAPLRGGKRIRGGRREHREETKDMIHWDPGTRKHINRIAAEKKAEKEAHTKLVVEKTAKALPRKLGEF